jgi:AcrR family transcriptional regulator
MPRNHKKPRTVSAKNRDTNNPYHHGDLRNELMSATVAIAEKNGLDGLTLRKAAAYVGVSHAAPAHHFGNLRGLLAATAERGFTQLCTHMQKAQAQAENPLRGLQAVGLAYVRFAVRNPGLFRIMHHASLENKSDFPELLTASHATFATLIEAVVKSQNLGLVRTGDPRQLALCAWAMVHGLSTLLIDQQTHSKGITDDADTLALSVTGDLYLGLKV